MTVTRQFLFMLAMLILLNVALMLGKPVYVMTYLIGAVLFFMWDFIELKIKSMEEKHDMEDKA